VLSRTADQVLDAPHQSQPDPDELVRAAMAWHFDPATGSPFWLARAATLGFDPRSDITSYDDLRRFPDVSGELRNISARELIPSGYGSQPDIVGVFESGGTTGSPKRVICLRDWLDRLLSWDSEHLDAAGFPTGADWLSVTPSGPHIVGELVRRSALARGGLSHSVDLDPRWVKSLIAAGRKDESDDYSGHLIEQVEHILTTQDIQVLTITPPLLERLARRDDLLELVRTKVKAIRWGGTQLDQDSQYLYRTEVFPETVLFGHYGSTMTLGFASQRTGQGADEPSVFDPLAPFVTFSVVDPSTREPVPYGERGQVVTNHVSRSFLLPNNLERDMATRVEWAQAGDSVADIGPVARFEEQDVIEGVY
jgi:phenylacetate-coenzyme A ligase PaaK-like adenylate-forming protein